ncbi:hypothetical protein Nepgr_026586 [Nepenthes gracilis]|uniref:Secreted protein n=1 Tax=Nepenthes gracilis TaxID=150966 RepID=A0AAD3T8C2_NEPGR|nr:hypothetical protein Nepgr_026586 [Nepenthes gracilis]
MFSSLFRFLSLSACGILFSAPPLFDPSRSRTFRSIRCDNLNCIRTPRSFYNIATCGYRVSYGDSTFCVATKTFIFAQNLAPIKVIFSGQPKLTAALLGGPETAPSIAGFAAGGLSIVA